MAKFVTWADDKQFKDIWKNEPGVIIGRGENDYLPENNLIADFTGRIVGCNTSFKTYNLDALVWMDRMVFTENKSEISLLDCLKFAIDPHESNYGPYSTLIYGLRANQPEKCVTSFTQGFYPCNLSGYLALNVALIMGCNPIWLYGFLANTEPTKTRSESFYIIQQWAQKNGREIYVADKSSLLTKFFPYKSLPLIKKKPKIKTQAWPRYNKICIIGHGNSMTGGKFGDLIDSYDCIIRMANCGWQENIKDYGHRYDYGIYCPDQKKYIKDELRLPKYKYFCYVPNGKNKRWKLKTKGKETWCFEKEIEEWKGPRKILSRGLASIIIACEIFDPKAIDLFGFDQVRTGDPGSGPRHPEELQRLMGSGKNDSHDWNHEKKIIEQICGHYGVNINFLP